MTSRPIRAAAAYNRLAMAMKKMAPGTMGGQSRVANLPGFSESLIPYGLPAAPPLPFGYIFNDDTVFGWPAGGNYPAEWVPVPTTVSATPMTFEVSYGGAFGNLTGCQLPDGRGLLMWTQNAGGGLNVRCAVQPSPSDWLTDDFVDSGDAATIITTVLANSAVPYVIDGELYATVAEGNNCQIWKANDPANPVAGGWTVHGTLPFGGGVEAAWGDFEQVASVPIVTSGGLWCIVQGYSTQYYFGGPTGLACFSWAHFTSPDGATWTKQNGTAGQFYATAYVTRQFVEDSGGNINFSDNPDSGTNTYYFVTPAVGGTLTSAATSGDPPRIQAILRNDADEIYAIDHSGYFRLRVNDGVPYSDWTDTGVVWHFPTPGLAAQMFKLFVLTSSA